MKVAWIFVSMLGIVSGLQMFHQLGQLRVISRSFFERALLFFPMICLILGFFMRAHLIFGLLLVTTFHIFPITFMSFNLSRRKRRFQRGILPFLDELILKMKAGKAFRESLIEIPRGPRSQASVDLTEIASQIRYPDRKNHRQLLVEAQDLLIEMQKMDRSSARVIEKITAFRRREKMIQRFRQRSSQLTSQVRAQAVVCGFLYALLLIWTVFNDPKLLFSPVVFVSMLLFLLGLMLMTLISRSFRWKL